MIRRDDGLYLRSKAAEYRRQAAAINQPAAAARLLAMACELEKALAQARSTGLLDALDEAGQQKPRRAVKVRA